MLDRTQRPNTGEGRGSQHTPYLFRSFGSQCCSPLTSGATTNLQALELSGRRSRAMRGVHCFRMRGWTGEELRCRIAFRKHASEDIIPHAFEQPSCGISDKFCDRQASWYGATQSHHPASSTASSLAPDTADQR